MKIIIVWIMALLLPMCVYAGNTMMSKSVFTSEFLTYLETQVPDSKFSVVNDLHLFTNDIDGYELNIFLDNAYDVYFSESLKIELVFSNQLDSIKGQKKAFSNSDVQSIFPVVKSKIYIETAKKQLKEAGYDKDELPFFFEKINDDLYLLYVFDSQKSMRFVSPKDVEKHRIKESIRGVASKNMERYYSQISAQLREIDTKGNGQVYIFSADENYEASIVTTFDYLKRMELEIAGDPVVFIPARNIALIVGSKDHKALQVASNITIKGYNELGYSISPFGYVNLNGKWSRFEP